MISLGKDILIRGFDDSVHSELGKKAETMGVSINSIVKDAVEQWLDKKSPTPHVHDLLIYSDEKSMNNFLKSLDRMTSSTEWFKSFAVPPKHHTEKVLSKLDWFNGTVKPYKPHGVDGSKYCGKVIQNIAKSSEKKPLCCVDFIITDIANNSFSHAMELERTYDDARLPGLMFCPYKAEDFMKSDLTDMIELFLMHDRIFVLKNDGIYKLHITKESIHKIFLN
ncbi:hypothetical protein NPIRD3C_1903 [Nitrosopumilus piranensis]|uniref:Uncharacterized protein n=1 Tax=Nitrosopumilus piranensis TaxID=1582439 RepID=A0A0C5BTP5_9ARCH|nr:hypothetical protein NPIRD3C_1903 [Nitrosopumilus piranensis]